MTSSPDPPRRSSRPPRPRITSSPSLPYRKSRLSVPKIRPPLGQPGRSFVVKRAVAPSPPLGSLVVLVPWHRASSEAVAWGDLPSSFLEVSELVPAQPTTRRIAAHPIRKVNHSYEASLANYDAPAFSWHVSSATSTSKHATQRTLAHLYAGLFSGVRGIGILRTSPLRSPRK